MKFWKTIKKISKNGFLKGVWVPRKKKIPDISFTTQADTNKYVHLYTGNVQKINYVKYYFLKH